MPTAAGPDDEADGDQNDEEDALAVPGFGSSASVGDAGSGGVLELHRRNMCSREAAHWNGTYYLVQQVFRRE